MLSELVSYISSEFEKAGIEYMISGSIAMIKYTVPRMTRDIDVVIDIKEDDIPQFINSFKERFYFNDQTIKEEVWKKGMFNIIDNISGYKIDFIIRKESSYRKQEFQRKQRTTILGIETWIVSIEDLIISKLFWIQDYQSNMQMNDIKNLLDCKEIDYKYLLGNIKILNLKTFNLL